MQQEVEKNIMMNANIMPLIGTDKYFGLFLILFILSSFLEQAEEQASHYRTP